MAVPISVGVRVGATTFTRTFGARSAASAIAKPSNADLAAEIAQGLGNPVRAATDESKTIEPLSWAIRTGWQKRHPVHWFGKLPAFVLV